MEFPYFKVVDFPKHKLRERLLPWLRFGVFNPKDPRKIIYPIGLVDSGSNVTIIDREIGENLGIDIKAAKKGFRGMVRGVGGGVIEVFFHKIGFLIKDGKNGKTVTYEDYAAFTYHAFPASMPQQTAILGLIGFFNHFKICFNHPLSISLTKV